jgi:hypothetical protein
MAKTKNDAATERITISTTPQVVEALKWLAQQGYWGKNPAEVAEELMRRKLVEEFIEQKKFPEDGKVKPKD